MSAYLIRRLLPLIPTLIDVAMLALVVIRFVPDGPAEQVMMEMKGRDGGGEISGGGVLDYHGRHGVDTEKIKEIRISYGFDKSSLKRYLPMFGRFVHFGLGESYLQHRSVWDFVKPKLSVSISVGLWTFFLIYFIAVSLDVVKAVRVGSRLGLVISTIVLVGYAIPGLMLGVLLPVLFGSGTFSQWLPIRDITSDNWDQLSPLGKTTDYLWHVMPPVTASMVGNLAIIIMLTKNVFLEEIRKQYVLTVRSKGLLGRYVLWRHIFHNTLLLLVTGFPSAFTGAFFTGSLLIEQLFLLDGMGLLSYEAVMRRDYLVALGTLYLFTLIGLAARLISDVCYALVGPRVHFGLVGRQAGRQP